MVVVKQLRNEAYILVKVDGAILLLKFVAFWLIPYHPYFWKCLEITEFVDLEALESVEENEIGVLEMVEDNSDNWGQLSLERKREVWG